MQCRSFLLVALLFFSNLIVHAQHEQIKIVSGALKKIYEKSQIKQASFIKNAVPDLLFENMQLLEVSFESNEDNEGVITTFDPLAKTHQSLEGLEKVRYKYLYQFGKVGYLFDVTDRINGAVDFDQKSNEIKLDILNQIALHQCNTCMQSLQKFVTQQKIIHYKADIHLINESAMAIEDKFIWFVIKTPQTKKGPAHFYQGGAAFFVNPKNGAKADMSQYFMPPRIVEGN